MIAVEKDYEDFKILQDEMDALDYRKDKKAIDVLVTKRENKHKEMIAKNGYYYYCIYSEYVTSVINNGNKDLNIICADKFDKNPEEMFKALDNAGVTAFTIIFRPINLASIRNLKKYIEGTDWTVDIDDIEITESIFMGKPEKRPAVRFVKA